MTLRAIDRKERHTMRSTNSIVENALRAAGIVGKRTAQRKAANAAPKRTAKAKPTKAKAKGKAANAKPRKTVLNVRPPSQPTNAKRIARNFATAALAVMFAFAAQFAHGGYAWYSPAIRRVVEKLATDKDFKVTPPNVTLYGSFTGIVWAPPTAKYDSLTGTFTRDNDTSNIVDNYYDLNEYGKYDIQASLENFLANCGYYLTDEFGLSYYFYDDNTAAFYKTYEEKNFTAVRAAFENLNAIFQEWSSWNVEKTAALGVDASAFAQMVKDIDESLGEAKEQIAQATADAKALADKMNGELAQVQADLTLIAEEAVHEAQMRIDGAVSDFNSFIGSLTAAITKADGEGGVWDDSLFSNAMNELSKSEEELVDAIKALQGSSQDPAVQNAITVLGYQLSGVRGVKTSLAAAIENKDLDAAKSALSAACGLGLIEGRKAIAGVNNRLATLESKEKVIDILTGAALSAMDAQGGLRADIEKMRANFGFLFITMMDNFHKINAYLPTPDRIDNRAQCGPVKSQAKSGECAQTAISSYADFLLRRKFGRPFDTPPSRIVEHMKGNGTATDEGATLTDCLKALINSGIVSNRNTFVQCVFTFPGYVDRETIREAIGRHGAVPCSLHTTEEWELHYSNNGIKTPGQGLVRGRGKRTPAHVVILCGYDDYGVIFQNCWGKEWGFGGFGIIRWDAFDRDFIAAAVIEGFGAK